MKDGVLDERREGEKPYLAIGWRFLKANGKYRYVWLLKGKLSQEEEEGETKRISLTSNNKTQRFVY